MRSLVRGLVVLALAVGCTAGTAMKVRVTTAPGAALSRCSTYAWARPSLAERAAARAQAARDPWRALPSASEADDADLDQQIRSAIAAQLGRLGYVPVTNRPDFVLDYRISSQQQRFEDTPGAYAQYRREGGTESWGQVWVGGYEEGTLAVLAADPVSLRPLWDASATAVVNADLRRRRIPEAIGRMFADFPASAPR